MSAGRIFECLHYMIVHAESPYNATKLEIVRKAGMSVIRASAPLYRNAWLFAKAQSSQYFNDMW